MKAMTYGLGLMLAGIVVGLSFGMVAGSALIAIGTGLLLVSLIGVVDTDISHRQEELDGRADDVRRERTLF